MIASGTFFLPTDLFSQSEEKATIATVALAPPAINGCYNLMKWSGVNMDIPTQHGNVMDPLRYLQWCCTMPIIALLVCFSFNFTSKRGQSSSILKHREVIMIFANWVIVIGGMAADLSPVPYVVIPLGVSWLACGYVVKSMYDSLSAAEHDTTVLHDETSILALRISKVMYAATFIGIGTLWMCSAFAPSSYALDVFTVEVLYCCLDVLAKVITVCLFKSGGLARIERHVTQNFEYVVAHKDRQLETVSESLEQMTAASLISAEQLEIAEIERAMLQIQQQSCLSCSAVHQALTNQFLRLQSRSMKRKASLVAAWGGEKVATSDSQAGSGSPLGYCIAATTQDGGQTFKGRLLKGGELRNEAVLKDGSHSFVQCLGEPYLRIGLVGKKFGESAGHTLLASEAPVLFAGEVEFINSGTLTRWNNMSGTYKCEPQMCFQTGLPLDKFWSFHEGTEDELQNFSGEKLRTESGAVLARVLDSTDAEFSRARGQWDELVEAFISGNKHAAETLHILKHGTKQRCEAVIKYGYMSQVTPQEGV